MTMRIFEWVREHAPALCPNGLDATRIVELGARCADGQDHMCLRPLFDGCASYTGIDFEDGYNVDIVEDISAPLVFGRTPAKEAIEKANLVIICETLEHIPTFWNVLSDIRHLVEPGTLLLVSVPDIGFPYHEHPVDCYRFTEYALRSVMPGIVINFATLPDTAGNLCHLAVSILNVKKLQAEYNGG